MIKKYMYALFHKIALRAQETEIMNVLGKR